MSFTKAKAYLESIGFADHIIETEASTATVAEAAEALGVEPGMIAKTMSFLIDGRPILVLAEGTARIDNRKYKDTFHSKAKMIPFEEVEGYIGHAPGGVCPFGIHGNVEIYHSAVRLTIPELEQAANARGWVDVCKEAV